MPVDDHPIHESTRISADAVYGCYNRQPFASGYFAPDRRYKADGTFYIIQTRIQYQNSHDCRYDMADTDPRCNDCKWKMK